MNLNSMILPTALFILSYVAIMSERADRAIVALLGAGIAIALGMLNQEEAMRAIDFKYAGALSRHDDHRRHHQEKRCLRICGCAHDPAPARVARQHPVRATAHHHAILSPPRDTTVLLMVPVTVVICSELPALPVSLR
jgi:hypothetical protein